MGGGEWRSSVSEQRQSGCECTAERVIRVSPSPVDSILQAMFEFVNDFVR